jgi:hypothetical protein
MTHEHEHAHTIECDENDVTTLRIAGMIDDDDDAIDALHVPNIRVIYCATLFAYVARTQCNVVLRNVQTQTLHAIECDEYDANAYVARATVQTTRMHVAIALMANDDV